MKTSNPIFNSKALENVMPSSTAMTVNGAVNKTFVLLGLALISAAISVNAILTGAIAQQMFMPLLIGSSVVGAILLLIAIFKPTSANLFALLYSIVKGIFLGLTTIFFEAMYPGIAMQAVAGTLFTLFAMLFLYKTKIIKVTNGFRSAVIIGTLGLCLVYFIDFIGNFIPFLNIPMVHEATPLGIAFTAIACVLAAFNLALDFDNIEQGAKNFLPKQYEWVMALGLMVTLVWLYVEILRLLAKLRR